MENKKFVRPRITPGIRGVDDFMYKFSDGTIYKWPTKEELEEALKLYPMPSAEELIKIKRDMGIDDSDIYKYKTWKESNID